MTAPDPMNVHPLNGFERTVFLRPTITSEKIIVGDYTYYDDPELPLEFERRNVLYSYGPERLIIGKFCSIGSGTTFIMAGANHLTSGVSAFPFGIFSGTWQERTIDLFATIESKGDTVIGNDVWFGYQTLIMPGITIGNGAIIAAGCVVTRDVPPYSIVGGNPSTVIRQRFTDNEIAQLQEAAWWDWPVDAITEYARTIMTGTPERIAAIAKSITPHSNP